MWNDERIGIKHKLALYVQFVQVATYGAEAWQLDDDIESRIRRWNAYNLATITTASSALRRMAWVGASPRRSLTSTT